MPLEDCDDFNEFGPEICDTCLWQYICWGDDESPCGGYCPAFATYGLRACEDCELEVL